MIKSHWPQLAMLSASRELRICGIFGSAGLSLVWKVKGALLLSKGDGEVLTFATLSISAYVWPSYSKIGSQPWKWWVSVSPFEQCREHVNRIRKGATYRNRADPSAAQSYLAYVLGIGLVPRRDQRRMRTCRLPMLTCLRMRRGGCSVLCGRGHLGTICCGYEAVSSAEVLRKTAVMLREQ
jgi:hypothetical protein